MVCYFNLWWWLGSLQ